MVPSRPVLNEPHADKVERGCCYGFGEVQNLEMVSVSIDAAGEKAADNAMVKLAAIRNKVRIGTGKVYLCTSVL